MSYKIKSISPRTGMPVGFIFNGKHFSRLGVEELQDALTEVLSDNLELKRRKDLDTLLTQERLMGLDSQVKEVRFNKLMQELKS